MSERITPDPATLDRLQCSAQGGADSAAILSAVVHYLVATIGPAGAARELQRWAEAVERIEQ